MAALFAKRGLWIGLGLLAIVLAALATVSYVAGNRLANIALSIVLEDITGRRVVVTEAPVIRMFPTFTAEFREISFHNRRYDSDQFPVLSAPVMRLSLSVVAALKGKTRITGIVLERPEFRAKAQDGRWQLPLGAQSKFLEPIVSLTNSLPQDQFEAILTDARDNAFGHIKIVDGRIVLDSRSTDVISSLNGSLSWMPGARNGSFSGKAMWRGEAISFSGATDDIAMLALGADTGIAADFRSKPLTSRFSGTVRLSPSPYFEGKVFAQADSLLAAMRWQGVKTPLDLAAFGLTLSGAVKGDLEKLQLEDSQLQLGTNEGTGSLIFQPNMAPPMLSGTLDFVSLDLAMLTKIFELGPKAPVTINAEPAMGADLRISASNATFGSLALRKVAASLQISKQANFLDIHDAAAFGGTMQMSMKRQNNTIAQTELRILANDIETKALASLGGDFADLPQARGSLSAILSGPNIAAFDFFATAEGTVKLRLGAGTLPSMNANQMVRALRKGGFFQLKGEAPSVLSFTEINAEASLAQGTLQFNPLRIGLDEAAMLLTGTYAVKDQNIALTGTLDLEEGHPEAPNGAESIKIFFGGNRDALLMSGLQ